MWSAYITQVINHLERPFPSAARGGYDAPMKHNFRAMLKTLAKTMTQQEIADAIGTSQAMISFCIDGTKRLTDFETCSKLVALHARKSPSAASGQSRRVIAPR